MTLQFSAGQDFIGDMMFQYNWSISECCDDKLVVNCKEI